MSAKHKDIWDLAAIPDRQLQPARETLTVRLEPATLAWIQWRALQDDKGPSVVARHFLEQAARQDREWQDLRRRAQQELKQKVQEEKRRKR